MAVRHSATAGGRGSMPSSPCPPPGSTNEGLHPRTARPRLARAIIAGQADDVRASRRPVLVAVGPDGGASALRAGRTMAEREARPLVVLSVVEPPPLHTLDPERVMLVPWTIDEQVTARRQAIHDQVRQVAPTAVRRRRRGDRGPLRRRHRHHHERGAAPPRARHRDGQRAARTAEPPLRHRDRARHDSPRRVPRGGGDRRRHPPPRTVVVAMDFSPASLHAARHALPHLSDGAVVHLVHVWQRQAPLLPTGGAVGPRRGLSARPARPLRSCPRAPRPHALTRVRRHGSRGRGGRHAGRAGR